MDSIVTTERAGFRRAQRIASAEMSEIVQVSEAAARMRAAGRDVISLGTGEPDFPTPEHVCAAATAAMAAGETRYPPTAGTPALRAKVAEGAGVAAENVIISTGAKQALFNLFFASLDEGDEVICPTPYWTSYRDMIGGAQGKLVELVCGPNQGYKLVPEQLAAAITPKTRWLLLNSPSNPSGAMYSRAELEALGDVLRQHEHVWVVSDEIYEHIAYVPFTSIRDALPDLVDRSVVINGVSKAYSMTGWRLGWAIGPVEAIKAMAVIQGQSTSGASSISQAAALAALSGDQSLLEERKASFQHRRDLVVSALNAIPQLHCPVPEGAFYVFPDCSGLIGMRTPDGQVIEDDADFCRYLLETEGLALVPGRAFSGPRSFRLSYAYAEEILRDALQRITRAVAALQS